MTSETTIALVSLIVGVAGVIASLWQVHLSGGRIFINNPRVEVSPEFPTDDFSKQIKKNAQSVKFLQTWMGNFTSFENALQEAIIQKTDVKILLLHPFSPFAEARAKDLHHSLDGTNIINVPELIKDNIVRLRIIQQSLGNPHNLEVRLYNATPIMTLYWYNSTCYMGLFWRNKSAIQGPQFRVNTTRNTPLAKVISQHFDDLWDANDTISLTDFFEKDLAKG